MKELFKNVLGVKGVTGVMLFSSKGELLFKEFNSPIPHDPEKTDLWPFFIGLLEKVREADLVFEKRRLYIRKTGVGFLMVIMGPMAPIAMVRLNCDLLLPALKEGVDSKNLGRLVKKKK
jgi:hypothetical protein